MADYSIEWYRADRGLGRVGTTARRGRREWAYICGEHTLIDGAAETGIQHHLADRAEVVQSPAGYAVAHHGDGHYDGWHADTFEVPGLHAVTHTGGVDRRASHDVLYCRGVLTYEGTAVPEFPADLAAHARSHRMPVLTAVSQATPQQVPAWKVLDSTGRLGSVEQWWLTFADGTTGGAVFVLNEHGDTICALARVGDGPWVVDARPRGLRKRHGSSPAKPTPEYASGRLVWAAYTALLCGLDRALPDTALDVLAAHRDNAVIEKILAEVAQ